MKKRSNGSAQTSAAQVGMVHAVRLLDQHFDTDSGRYSDGWSDEQVAVAVDLSEPAIVSLRESAYGPLSIDPALAEIEKEFGELRTKIEKEHSEMNGLIQLQLDEHRKLMAAMQAKFAEASKGVSKRK